MKTYLRCNGLLEMQRESTGPGRIHRHIVSIAETKRRTPLTINYSLRGVRLNRYVIHVLTAYAAGSSCPLSPHPPHR